MGGADHALYLLACWVALDYLHDAWFYWTHRLLHHPWLLRRVHYVHHQSTVPTAYRPDSTSAHVRGSCSASHISLVPEK